MIRCGCDLCQSLPACDKDGWPNSISLHVIFTFVCPPIGCCIYSKPHKDGEDTDSDNDGEWDDCCHEHKVAHRHIPHSKWPFLLSSCHYYFIKMWIIHYSSLLFLILCLILNGLLIIYFHWADSYIPTQCSSLLKRLSVFTVYHMMCDSIHYISDKMYSY